MFKVGDKVIPSFKVGDRVKFKKSSVNTGMIDATEEDVFTVLYVAQGHVMLTEMGYWWNIDHFEHVKDGAMTNTDDAMNNTEEQKIKWEVGQVVWDVRNGRGIVKEIGDDEYYPIYVVFDLTDLYGDAVSDTYTLDGRYVGTQKNRSLFFSEPVITAELFPPKKPFVPILKKGDKVVLTDSVADYVTEVVREEENHIYYKTEDGVVTFVNKNSVKVFKLGEEIKFQ